MSFEIIPRGVYRDAVRQEQYASLEVIVTAQRERLYCELRVFGRCVEIHTIYRAPSFDRRTDEVDSLAVAFDVLQSWYGPLEPAPLVSFY